jgi:hypothetical protein
MCFVLNNNLIFSSQQSLIFSKINHRQYNLIKIVDQVSYTLKYIKSDI